MRNDDHPLIKALNRGKEENASLDFANVPSRMLELHHSEIPGLPGMKPGESITVKVHGHISHPGENSSVMQIHGAEPDSSEMDDEEFGAKDAIRVIPPSSNVPS